MAAVASAVELPASRRSHYYNTAPAYDIHDPNWIPLLNGVEYRKSEIPTEKEVSPYNNHSFSPFPKCQPYPHGRAQATLKYSKSSLVENVTSDHDVDAMSSTHGVRTTSMAQPTSIGSNAIPDHVQQRSRDALPEDGRCTTTSSDTGADDNSAPSTVGTVSLLNEQQYSLPPQQVLKNDLLLPRMPPSVRSSVASSRTSVAVPTSKYNRKPLPSVLSLPSSIVSRTPSRPPSRPQTPSQEAPPTPAPPTNQVAIPLLQPLPSPHIHTFEPPPVPVSAPRIQPTKSTASERKQRALHSHPSKISMNSNADGIASKPPSIKAESYKSTDSRTTPPSTIYRGPCPAPALTQAPTSPLPQAPPQATGPSTSAEISAKQSQATTPVQEDIRVQATPAQETLSTPSTTGGEHTEMAAFMANTNTVIFRRFDEVHVRLLLCLQDEIAQLEKELLALEGASMTREDRSVQRKKVMNSLRKVVAEYGKSAK